MKAKLTVIVPLYNQEKYIRQCVESILNQSMRDICLIIVNDGSTDKSLEICCDIASADKRVEVISQENRGLAGARLTGLRHARTKYVTFVDADDFILDDSYENAIPYLEKDVDEVFFEIMRYYSQNQINREYHTIEPGLYDKKKIVREIYPKLLWDFERGTPGIECSQCVRIVKKQLLIEAYEKLKGKSFYYGEDMVITYPVMKKISSLAVISKSYYMHRQRKGNVAPPYVSAPGYFDELTELYRYLRKTMKDEAYDFNKQIDYRYICSVELKKWAYGEYQFHRDFLFPFNEVPVEKRIVLYGAGAVGSAYYKQLIKLSYCKEILWVDKNAENINNSLVKPVSELESIASHSFDRVVIALENKTVAKQVRDFLLSIGYASEKIVI